MEYSISMATRRAFLQTAAGAAASARLGWTAGSARPNIVLMMADDMGFSDVGCYGSEIHTPNIDGLASSGVRFTHFHNTARCCPTRASLLSGLYPHQTGVGHMVDNPKPFPGYTGDLNRSCVTIAEALRGAGYQTRMAGKWHVTPVTESKHNWPLQRGFDEYYGIIQGAASYFDPGSLTRNNDSIRAEQPGYYLTDAIGSAAAGYIELAGRQTAPYFLYVAFTSPHWPLHALREDIDRQRGRYKDGWDALREERHSRMIKMGLVEKRWALTPRDPQAPAWKDAPNKEWYQRRMEVYAAQIERMDYNVGRILESLRKAGQENNTLVLFLADNGGCAEELGPKSSGRSFPAKTHDGRTVRIGNLPELMPGAEDTYQSYGLPWANASNTPFRRYKHWVHEGGTATPLIARWPQVIRRHGALDHQPGHLIDLMATCVDLAGAKYPETYRGAPIVPMEGSSLRPAFEGKKIERTDAIYWEHEGNRAMCDGRWKIVSRYPDRWELYDLEADRTELNDLAGKDPSRLERMAAQYERWATRCLVEPWDKVQKAPQTPAPIPPAG
jgi:arylsulfatase A-like enzyme